LALAAIADLYTIRSPMLACDFRIDARHDFHEGRLTCAVHTNETNLRIRIKRQMHIIENGFIAEFLRQTLHMIAELAGHGASLVEKRNRVKKPAASGL
jgi:hypothetical protein